MGVLRATPGDKVHAHKAAPPNQPYILVELVSLSAHSFRAPQAFEGKVTIDSKNRVPDGECSRAAGSTVGPLGRHGLWVPHRAGTSPPALSPCCPNVLSTHGGKVGVPSAHTRLGERWRERAVHAHSKRNCLVPTGPTGQRAGEGSARGADGTGTALTLLHYSARGAWGGGPWAREGGWAVRAPPPGCNRQPWEIQIPRGEPTRWTPPPAGSP